MEIRRIIVDEIPKNCGECMLCTLVHDAHYECRALPEDINDIEGSPYDMKYRRSDCPLEVENDWA